MIKTTLRRLAPRSLVNGYHWLGAVGATLYYNHPASKLTVIGVTGTDGKTTTSNLIHHILRSNGKRSVLISTIGAVFDDEVVDVGLHVTSPSPFLLQRLLKRAETEGYEYVVLEATSHGFDQHRLLGTNIQYGVITNISHEHLDYHHSMDHYMAAKAKILLHAKSVVVNKKNSYVKQLIERYASETHVIWFDRDSMGQFKQTIRQHFRESYNQENALAAALVCQQLGMDPASINKALAKPLHVAGRMEEISNSLGIRIIVDFAHTPQSLETVLTSLRKTTKKRLIAVFGAAGERDATKRPVMGDVASTLADLVVLTTEDPRSENVNSIIYQIKSGVKKNHQALMTVVDRKEAIQMAIFQLAHTDDTVAFLGKGHEQSMNVDGATEIPWSDVEVVNQNLKGKS